MIAVLLQGHASHSKTASFFQSQTQDEAEIEQRHNAEIRRLQQVVAARPSSHRQPSARAEINAKETRAIRDSREKMPTDERRGKQCTVSTRVPPRRVVARVDGQCSLGFIGLPGVGKSKIMAALSGIECM